MRFELGPHADAVEQRVKALVAAGAAECIWARDVGFWRGDAQRQASVGNRLGWLDIARRMQDEADDIVAFADSVRGDGFMAAVLLGMGGSSLAPEVLRQTLAPHDGHPRLYVLDTTDPATIHSVVNEIDVARTLFFVSSKSGATIEMMSLFRYFYILVEETKEWDAGENFVAITDERTSLAEMADEYSFRRTFTNPSDIGGRYSALSYFGLVPAAVAGVDVRRLLERAVTEMDAARGAESEALRLGAALGELALAGRDKATLLLAAEVGAFGLWAEQLIAESTGKQGTGIVPVIGEMPGSPLKYGDDRAFVQLRMEAGSTSEDDAVAGALTAEGFPVISIDLEDGFDLGREFFRWEFAVAVAGHVLDINPFDEPNVQESKDNTSRVLDEFEQRKTLDVEGIDEIRAPLALTPGANVADEDIAGAIEDLLGAVGAGDYFAITAYVPPTELSDEVFGEIRALVRDHFRCATTLGYGPRFLHSTGQLHKGGPPNGVFLQVTCADVDDIEIPAHSFTFGQLKRAQAIGDFESLAAHNRPVLRVHLGTDVRAGLGWLIEAVRAALDNHR